jgi:hypothetical protein
MIINGKIGYADDGTFTESEKRKHVDDCRVRAEQQIKFESENGITYHVSEENWGKLPDDPGWNRKSEEREYLESSAGEKITVATLFHQALKNGWKKNENK